MYCILSTSALLTFGAACFSVLCTQRLFGGLSDLHPLDAGGTPLPRSCDDKLSPDIAKVPRGAKLPLGEGTPVLEGVNFLSWEGSKEK